MKRVYARNVEASYVPTAMPKELGCAEHVEGWKNRKTPIRSHVRIATDYTYNATAVAVIVTNMYLKDVHMIRPTSGGSVKETSNMRGDVGQRREQRHQVKIHRPLKRKTKQFMNQEKRQRVQQKLKTPMSKAYCSFHYARSNLIHGSTDGVICCRRNAKRSKFAWRSKSH